VLRRVLTGSRYFVLLGVLGSLLAAIVTMVFGAIAVIANIAEALRLLDFSEKGVKYLAVGFLQVIDVFLLATVLYIVALGLYELFLDPQFPAPAWLKVETLDDLKERIAVIVVIMLAVTFLASAVTQQSGSDLLRLGASVALVLGGLGVFFRLTRHTGDGR